MKSTIFIFLLSLVLLWPTSALSEHLAGTTAHVREFDDGTWQADFKVELWSQKNGASTLWRLTINEQGCQMIPLGDGAVQQGAFSTWSELPQEWSALSSIWRE